MAAGESSGAPLNARPRRQGLARAGGAKFEAASRLSSFKLHRHSRPTNTTTTFCLPPHDLRASIAIMSGAWAPNPPNFYKQFTPANIERLAQLKQEQGNQTPNLLSLPPEIRYLVPPEPPADGVYDLFGSTRTIHDFLATLPDQNITQVYPSASDTDADTSTSANWTLDRGKYLKNIARSILLSFLELAGTLAEDPGQSARKLEEIKTLFQNAHHLINEYRPHQAREGLILKMEEEVERTRGEIEEVRRMRERIEGVLGGGEGDVDVEMDGLVEEGIGEGEMKGLEVQTGIWEALDREFPRSDG